MSAKVHGAKWLWADSLWHISFFVLFVWGLSDKKINQYKPRKLLSALKPSKKTFLSTDGSESRKISQVDHSQEWGISHWTEWYMTFQMQEIHFPRPQHKKEWRAPREEPVSMASHRQEEKVAPWQETKSKSWELIYTLSIFWYWLYGNLSSASWKSSSKPSWNLTS